MESAVIVSSVLILVIIGFVKIKNQKSKIIENTGYIKMYRDKFVDFSNSFISKFQNSNSFVFDIETYNWLIMNSVKAQEILQGWGYMNYKPAFKNYYINDYPIILNTLPKFRSNDLEMFDLNSVDDSILRCLGDLEIKFNYLSQNSFNPIVLFKEGIKEVLSWPLLILFWFGLLNYNTFDSIKLSSIFNFISGLIALFTFISSLVTILLGAEESIEIINRILNR